MPSFFTRPNISDTQFRQLTGDTMTMSGVTNFVGILKSKNIEIDASYTGPLSAVTGSVLTLIGNKVVLSPSSGGDPNFNGNRTVTRSGLPSVNVGTSTVNGFLEEYFFPDIPPGAALTISGSSTLIRYFGNNSTVGLAYTATRNTLPITSITLDGNTIPITNGGNTQSGTSGKTLTTPNTNQTFVLAVSDGSNVTNANASVVFRDKRYYFGNPSNLISENDANTTISVNLEDNGSTAEFATSRVKSTFSINLSGEFFYYVYDSTYGAASFTINGLLNNDFTVKTFSFTNPFGFVKTFRMYRSNNVLTGTFNIAVS